MVVTTAAAHAQNHYCQAAVALGDLGGDWNSKFALIKEGCKPGEMIGIPTRGNLASLIPVLCDFTKTVTQQFISGGFAYCVFVGTKPTE
jgi:hypothetical protein